MDMDLPIEGNVVLGITKRTRARKRGTLTTLQKQIEFYFGDANLQHDWGLMKKMRNNKDGFVLIDVVAARQRIKQITNDMSMISKAIQNSSLLQMNKDLTMVRRIAPLQKRNADARTVYVERLPVYVSEEWLRSIFACCGSIEYISLPRYKNSGEVKGFAFIEYKSEEDAEKACQVLNSIYIKLNNIYDADLVSCQMDASFTHQKRMKRDRSLSVSSSDDDHTVDDGMEKRPAKKRQKIPVDVYSSSESVAENSVESKDVSCTEIKNYTDCLEDISGKCERAGRIEIELQTVEKRKRKRKKRIREENEVEVPPLYVIHKKEWLRLKTLYKSLQRDDVSKLKAELKRIPENFQSMHKHTRMEHAVENHSCLEKTKQKDPREICSRRVKYKVNKSHKVSSRHSRKVRGKEKVEKLIQQIAERRRMSDSHIPNDKKKSSHVI